MTRIAESRDGYSGLAMLLAIASHRAGRKWSLFHVSSLRPTIAIAIGAQAGQDHARPTGEAGAPNLSTYIAIASVALCIFCIVYFGGQLLRGAF